MALKKIIPRHILGRFLLAKLRKCRKHPTHPVHIYTRKTFAPTFRKFESHLSREQRLQPRSVHALHTLHMLQKRYRTLVPSKKVSCQLQALRHSEIKNVIKQCLASVWLTGYSLYCHHTCPILHACPKFFQKFPFLPIRRIAVFRETAMQWKRLSERQRQFWCTRASTKRQLSREYLQKLVSKSM